MTDYLVISLPKIPYAHRIYMVLAKPNYKRKVTFVFQRLQAPNSQCLHVGSASTINIHHT